MSCAILDNFEPHEPIELTQQLIRIPSFLWNESAVGYWIMQERDFEVDLQEVPRRREWNEPSKC